MERARQLAKSLNVENFKFSSGWFTNFKRRYNLTMATSSGESSKVDQEEVDNWQAKYKSTILSYDPQNVFNADETGMFYRMQPQQTYNILGEKCFGETKARTSSLCFCART